MFNQQAIKSTLQVNHAEHAAFLSERPTIRISRAELNDILFQDVMQAVSDEDCLNVTVEVAQ